MPVAPSEPEKYRKAKAKRLRSLLALWNTQPTGTNFAATIHQFGGEAVEVRLTKAAAITALADAIAALEK